MLLEEIREIIFAARENVARSVDSSLTTLYWHVGRRIHQDILKEKRAGYGEQLISMLGERLATEFGRGFGEKNLRRMVQFAEVFPDAKIVVSLLRQLSWTHFLRLIPIKDPLKRDFYAEMCRIERWSTRALDQKRIVVDGEDYYLDLLFYHRHLRRLIAVELKLEEFKPADKGQMELYLRWLDRHERQEGEEKPVGLILCAGQKRETIESLDLHQSGIRVASYWTQSLPKKELERKLHKAVQLARARLGQHEKD